MRGCRVEDVRRAHRASDVGQFEFAAQEASVPVGEAVRARIQRRAR